MKSLTQCTWTSWEEKAPFSAFHFSRLSSSWVPCWSSVCWNNLRVDQAKNQHHSTRYQHLWSRHMLLQWMKHVHISSLTAATQSNIYGYIWMKLTDNDKQDIPNITVVSHCSFICGRFWVKIAVLTIYSPSRQTTLHETIPTFFHIFFCKLSVAIILSFSTI
jgi:hypothetical protein